MSYWLHPAAEEELSDSAAYYGQHASRRVAEAFLEELEAAFHLLELNQRLGRRVAGGLRLYSLRRFPFSLVYREDASGPRILTVAHQKRKPGYWRNRL
ncbi:MAG: type II toxin-antitoxin system RelE/ParE family toxin [Thermoanaerobaculia bacterium]|nr:type II toxin-antitoxin system RelE/ParE family toxin [Thermoanaerobaculia bacterium]